MWGWRSTGATASIHHGDADTTVPPQHARLYAKAIPGAQLRLHPGQGHFSIFPAVREILTPLTG
jgi:PhoPQ-activated pathogenicity-related protein